MKPSLKVLMVCLGNICRSPLAEGILASKLDRTSVLVDSAGTAAYHIGNLPDQRSIEIARQKGIDITNQRARKVGLKDFEDFDYIYAMDQSNFQDLKDMAKDDRQKSKVRLIMNELYPFENISVPDPYYGGEDGFVQVFDMLDKACDEIVKKIL